MALAEISYYMIFGKPLIFYLGLSTITSFFFTASISVMNRRGIHVIPFKWHPRMAAFSLTLASIHGFLAAAYYF